MDSFKRTFQYYKFCAYGFLKNLRFFDIFFLLFLREVGIKFLYIGVLYSVRQITINLFEIPSGLVADGWGRKRALLLAFLNYLTSFLIFFFSTDYRLFMMAMIFFGIGEAFRSGTHKAMILDYLKIKKWTEHSTRFYGSTRSWSQLGSALSSLVAIPIVFFSASYRILFLASAIPYVLDFLLILSYPNELNGSRWREQTQIQLWDELKTHFRSFILSLKNKWILKAYLNTATYIAFFKGTKDYLQPLLKVTALSLPIMLQFSGQQRTAILVGSVFFILYIFTSLASRFSWRIEQYFTTLFQALNKMYLIGVMSIALTGILIIARKQVLAILLFIFLYLIQNIRRPLAVSYLSKKIDNQILASGLSTESQLETLLVAIYAPFLGWLIDISGLGAGLVISSITFLIIYPLIRLKN